MSCAKQSDSAKYRALAEAIRMRTGEIPLLTAEIEDALRAEKSQACFFTGHRDVPVFRVEDVQRFQLGVRDWLEMQVESMIYRGFSTFYCGGARGFDLLAAAAVLHLKQQHPHIRPVLLLPCREQTRGWYARDLALHLAVLERAEAYYLQQTYDRSCMHRRNRMMVDLSIAGVAYYDPKKERSGTGMTVRYAEECGRSLIFLPYQTLVSPVPSAAPEDERGESEDCV